MHTLRKKAIGMKRGGFAEVYPLNSFQVLKLTTCQATRELFGSLSKEKRVPVGLPVVFEELGVCGVDSEVEEPLYGWVIERLFKPEERTPAQMARVHGQAVTARKLYPEVSAYTKPSPIRVSDIVEASKQIVLRQTKKERGSLPSASRFFLELASAVDETLQPALVKLSSLSQEYPSWRPDLVTSGNLLVDMKGTVTFGDPVYHFSKKDFHSVGKVIPVRVPVKMRGGQVTTLPVCLIVGSEEEETLKREALVEAGLAPGPLLDNTGKAHLTFMERGAEEVDASLFPMVGLRLRLNDYEKLLSDLI
jgi:hypothetical protein